MTPEMVLLLRDLSLDGVTADDKYRLQVVPQGKVIILRVSGFLLQPVPLEFSSRFEALISSETCDRVLIDLKDCTYMSSAVMSYLVKYFDITSAKGGRMAMVSPNEKVLRVLKAIGLDSFFEMYPSEAEAMAVLDA